jgi:hypothetical protein
LGGKVTIAGITAHDPKQACCHSFAYKEEGVRLPKSVKSLRKKVLGEPVTFGKGTQAAQGNRTGHDMC